MSKFFKPKWAILLVGLLLIAAIAVSLSQKPAQTARAAANVIVNGATNYQVIDGFGASDAFHTGAYVRGYGTSITAAQSAEIVKLLFSPTEGAGLNIIRHQVGSSTTMVTGVPSTGDGDNLASIEPTDPGGPNAAPVYVWDTADPDKGQVWFTQQAMLYTDPIVIADAWSAPAYMKTNGLLTGGGYLCGAVGAPACASGDWRQHYANYLTKYAQYYKDEGITIKYIGFGNEPEFSPSYTGMNWDSTTVAGGRGTLTASMPQNIDFIKNYLGPTLAAAGLTTKISCCEATSWANTAIYTSGILADATAAGYVGLITGHGYWGSPNGLVTMPITAAGSKRVWQTESSNFDSFTAAWDDGTNGSGFVWAESLYSALVKAQANGYLYWWFAQKNSSNTSNEDLIHIYDTSYTVTKRLWAFANFSRFIRPGATRISATSDNANLHITAARNTDGSYAIVVLNVGAAAETTSFDLSGGNYATVVTPYLTNSTNDLARQAVISAVGGSFSATIPARSLVTYSIPFGGPTPTPCVTCSPTPSKTPTKTITPTPTICLSCTLSVQYMAGDTSASSSQPSPHFKIVNTSNASIPLSALTLRYWYTIDGVKAQTFNCDYAALGCSNLAASFGTMSTAAATADSYLQIGFTGSGVIAAGGNSGEINARINKSDWSAYTQTNDYSFDAAKTAFAAWNNVTMYYNGTLIWGVEPGGVVGPTSTYSPTPSISKTPTRTLTSVISSTPTATLTRTLTPAISLTPTRTVTVGINLTPTRTVTAGISLTPTRTPTIGITNTPTRTLTPTTGASPTITPTVVGACTPVTSTITAPFTYDGAGTFCWQSSNLGAYINSWNTTSITINGVLNATNLYVAAGSLPARINGYWYVSYNSAVSYGHFEAK